MADELVNAIDELIELIREIPGIRSVMDEPSERSRDDVFVMIYPPDGSWGPLSAGMKKGLHNIQLGVYKNRKDLPRDMRRMLPFGDLVADKLLASGNTTWNGTIDNILPGDGDQITYSLGPVDYAELLLIGWTISIPVKIESVESSGVFSK